jgi:ParB-like chromosome segregation protein Spo0J
LAVPACLVSCKTYSRSAVTAAVYEAQGYAALIELQPDTYTVESIASRVGRSRQYVSGRLRLIQLIPEAKQAFYDEKLTVAQAFEIAWLQPNDQRRALQECFPQYGTPPLF